MANTRTRIHAHQNTVSLVRVRRIIRCVPLLRRAAQRGAKPALSLDANIEAIIVLGAAQYDGHPSRILSARLEEAVDAHALYPQIPIVTVGGKLPGDRFTEAEVGQSYLSERVPDACVLAVPVGNDTVESLREVRQRYGYANAIVITDPLHRLRVWLIARRGDEHPGARRLEISHPNLRPGLVALPCPRDGRARRIRRAQSLRREGCGAPAECAAPRGSDDEALPQGSA